VSAPGTLVGVSATATREPPPQPGGSGWLASLYDRFRHLVHEMGKFGVVGAIAFTVDTLIYASLLRADMEPLTAKTLTTVVSASVAFCGNRFWTWRHRERSGLPREYGLYFLLNVIGLAIGLAVLGLSHYGLGAVWPSIYQTDLADLVAAQLVGMAGGTLFRFWSYRRFVFLAPPAATPQVQPEVTDRSWKG
jgi:putative flippase GtrA